MLPLSLLCLPSCLLPQDAPTDPTEIRVVDLQAHIGFLASDELEGRESGERGGHLAAEGGRWKGNHARTPFLSDIVST